MKGIHLTLNDPLPWIMAHYSNETSVAVQKDARERSLRSLLQGLGVDVVIAVILVLGTSIGSLEWTPAYWQLLGATLAKTVVQAAASYVMRFYVTPKQSAPTV